MSELKITKSVSSVVSENELLWEIEVSDHENESEATICLKVRQKIPAYSQASPWEKEKAALAEALVPLQVLVNRSTRPK